MSNRRGMANLALVAFAFISFIVTLLTQVAKDPQIDSVWPTSVAGWIGIVIAAFLLTDNIIGRVKRPADAAAHRVEETLSADIKGLGEKLRGYAHQSEAQMENLEREMEREGKECAQRVSDLASRLTEVDRLAQKLNVDMAQSREDRRHISQDVAAWKVLIQDWRKEDRDRDDKQLETLTAVRLQLQQVQQLLVSRV